MAVFVVGDGERSEGEKSEVEHEHRMNECGDGRNTGKRGVEAQTELDAIK